MKEDILAYHIIKGSASYIKVISATADLFLVFLPFMGLCVCRHLCVTNMCVSIRFWGRVCMHMLLSAHEGLTLILRLFHFFISCLPDSFETEYIDQIQGSPL